MVEKGEGRGIEEYTRTRQKAPYERQNERDGPVNAVFCVYRAYVTKWDTYVCYISSLWQPLTYFFLRVLPYNSGANITTYGRKSNHRAGRGDLEDEIPGPEGEPNGEYEIGPRTGREIPSKDTYLQ